MDWDLLLIVLTLSVSAFVQSTTGFGFALLAVAILPMVMGVKEAIALIAFFNLVVSSVALIFNWSGFAWRDVRLLLPAFLAGIPFGFYFQHVSSVPILVRVLGLMLILIALSDIFITRRKKLTLPGWSAVPCGLLGGVIGGAFNTGGPPVVAYVYSQPWGNVRTVAALQCCFLLGGLTRNALMGFAGDYTRDLFILAAWSLGPTLLAIYAGRRLCEKLNRDLLRIVVFLFVLVMGLMYLIKPGG